MSVHVLTPGLLTTLQDSGRHGWRHLGVGCTGAADAFSYTVANRLVGNADDALAMEINLHGPRLRFDRDARIALCGAEIAAEADGVALPGWRPIDLPADTTLALGACRRGARVLLAIAGGFVAPKVLGSASTDLRGGFGGMRGRALAAGDVLPVAARDIGSIAKLRIAPWWIDPAPDLDFDTPAIIRLLPGRDATDPHDALLKTAWRVATASNRQGLRLEGPAVTLRGLCGSVSESVAPGAVQLPPDGGPIVLLADAQTHGGYPRIGHVIHADRPRLAQLRPGDTLRFEPCKPAVARRMACEQRQRLARLGYAVTARSHARWSGSE